MEELYPLPEMDTNFRKWDKKDKIENLVEYILDMVATDKFVIISVGTDSILKTGSRKKRLLTGKDWECSFFTAVSFSHNGGGRGHHVIFKEDRITGVGKYPLISRIWREVRMTIKLAEVISEKTEMKIIPKVHFDINPDENHQSNQLYSSALGFAKEKGFECECKPVAFVASSAADKLVKDEYGKKNKRNKGRHKTRQKIQQIKFK